MDWGTNLGAGNKFVTSRRLSDSSPGVTLELGGVSIREVSAKYMRSICVVACARILSG